MCYVIHIHPLCYPALSTILVIPATIVCPSRELQSYSRWKWLFLSSILFSVPSYRADCVVLVPCTFRPWRSCQGCALCPFPFLSAATSSLELCITAEMNTPVLFLITRMNTLVPPSLILGWGFPVFPCSVLSTPKHAVTLLNDTLSETCYWSCCPVCQTCHHSLWGVPGRILTPPSMPVFVHSPLSSTRVIRSTSIVATSWHPPVRACVFLYSPLRSKHRMLLLLFCVSLL